MNICIDGRHLVGNRTGIGKVEEQLLNGLRKNSNVANVYAAVFGKVDPVINSNIGIIKPKHVLGKMPTFIQYQYWLSLKVSEELKERHIDYFIGTNTFIPLNGKCKNISVIYDLSAYLLRAGEQNPLWRQYYKLLLPFHLRKADGIMVPSVVTKTNMLKLFPNIRKPIEVIPLGLDDEFKINEDNEFKKYIRNTYDLKGPILLFVGQVNGRKNLQTALKAFNVIKNELRPDTKFVICGERNIGWGSNEVEKYIDEMCLQSAIVYTGYVDKKTLIGLYNIADVLLFPSKNEGFGLPVVEAMACGLPVICSNKGALPEVVDDAAILLDPDDVDKWAANVLEIINDRNKKNLLINKGIARAKIFKWDNTVNKLIEFCKSL